MDLIDPYNHVAIGSVLLGKQNPRTVGSAADRQSEGMEEERSRGEAGVAQCAGSGGC